MIFQQETKSSRDRERGTLNVKGLVLDLLITAHRCVCEYTTN